MEVVVATIVQVIATITLIGFLSMHRWRRYFARRFRNGGVIRLAIVAVLLGVSSVGILDLLYPGTGPRGIAEVELATILVAGLFFATLLAQGRIVPSARQTHQRYLFVGAHPDDFELACGGTVAMLVDAGHEVRGITMSHGHEGGNSGTRLDEAREGAKFLGMASLEIHDFPDTTLHSVEREMTLVVEQAIDEFEPDVIFTHSAHDQHQDHASVHASVLRAARFQSSILCFESPSVTRLFDPSVFMDITRYLDVKVRAVQVHRDQSGKPYMTAQRIKGLAAFRGAQAKVSAAEGFEPVRLLTSAIGQH